MNNYSVHVEARTSCGVLRFYPINDAAKTFTALTKCDTLTKSHIKRIKELGYKVVACHIVNGNAIPCAEGIME